MKFDLKSTKAKQSALTSTGRKVTTKVLYNIFKGGLALTLSVCTVGGFFALGVAQGILDTAPNVEDVDIAPVGYATTIVDSNGEVTGTLVTSGSMREQVAISTLPDHLKYAFVDLEDARFYEHNGIDLKGIARAAVVALTTFDLSEGASTITQQVLKNNVFTDWTDEQTIGSLFRRKIQEQYLALQIEKIMNKDTILGNYLNTINLGANTLGVQAASKRYFGKDAKDLTISESAVLAPITQNPSAFNPISNPEENGERRKKCLDNMLAANHITKEEYEEALNDNVYERIQSHNIVIEDQSSIYTYFQDAIVEQVLNDLVQIKGYTPIQAENALYSGGLRIISTQDSAVQKICDDFISDDSHYPADKYSCDWALTVEYENKDLGDNGIVNYSQYSLESMLGYNLIFDSKEDIDNAVIELKEYILEQNGPYEILGEYIYYSLQPQASFVLMDQRTGYVKALVGGRGDKSTSLSYNRATEATRQPGSTFKIVSTYAPALDTAGYTLATKINDSEYFYNTGGQVVNWWGKYYYGDQSMRWAIARSANVIAVKVLTDISPQLGYDYVKNFGITTLEDSDCVQALSLGGLTKGVTNLELTAAYASIANGGVYHEPKFYSAVYDHNGKILLDNREPASRTVIKESTAYLLTSAMESVVNSSIGTASRAKISGITTAGKTGTTSNDYDLWFVGYSDYLTAGIWTGYDVNTYIEDDQYHKGMWGTLMTQIHEHYGYTDRKFTIPSSVKKFDICSSSGKLAGKYCKDTESEYFEIGTEPTEKCSQHSASTKTEDTTTNSEENTEN